MEHGGNSAEYGCADRKMECKDKAIEQSVDTGRQGVAGEGLEQDNTAECVIDGDGLEQAVTHEECGGLGSCLETGCVDKDLEYIEKYLMIQDKAGQLRPLVFNSLQRRLYDAIKAQRDADRPVRIIILKARQIGFSTAVAAMFYQRAATVANTHAMIVAHKADASTNIFNKTKLFFECSPAEVRPMKKASNAKEILFENPTSKADEKATNPGLRSKIEIETAGNRDAGRSATVHLLHLSELAFWPHAEQTMASLMQAVPNLPGTMVVIESTANGVGGAFYKEWQRAIRRESAFEPLFFPWYEHDEYRMD